MYYVGQPLVYKGKIHVVTDRMNVGYYIYKLSGESKYFTGSELQNCTMRL